MTRKDRLEFLATELSQSCDNPNTYLLDGNGEDDAPLCVVSIKEQTPIVEIQHASVIDGVGPEDLDSVEKVLGSLAGLNMRGFYSVVVVKNTLVCLYTQRIIGATKKRSVFRCALCDGLSGLHSAMYEIQMKLKATKKEDLVNEQRSST